jgi:hypothetical protein
MFFDSKRKTPYGENVSFFSTIFLLCISIDLFFHTIEPKLIQKFESVCNA